MPGDFSLPGGEEVYTTSLGVATYVMDASGEICAYIFEAPKTGNLTRFEANVAVLGNAFNNGLRFSFQDVSLTTGLPDGVVDQFATIASGSQATGWADPGDFDAPRAVTKGDLLCAVVDNASFTAADSITMTNMSGSLGGTIQRAFPYAISATNTKNSSANLPIIALRYDDGSYVPIYGTAPWVSIGSTSYDTGTTPDEIALAYTPPVPFRAYGLRWIGAVPAAGNYDAVLYDSGGGVIASASFDGDVTGTTGNRWNDCIFDATVDLAVGSEYFATIKPTTTNNLTIFHGVLPGLAYFDALPGGQAAFMAQRTDAGAWTKYNNGTDGYRRAFITLRGTYLDNGASAGGGGGFIISG
jgi:hypothetical protein